MTRQMGQVINNATERFLKKSFYFFLNKTLDENCWSNFKLPFWFFVRRAFISLIYVQVQDLVLMPHWGFLLFFTRWNTHRKLPLKSVFFLSWFNSLCCFGIETWYYISRVSFLLTSTHQTLELKPEKRSDKRLGQSLFCCFTSIDSQCTRLYKRQGKCETTKPNKFNHTGFKC